MVISHRTKTPATGGDALVGELNAIMPRIATMLANSVDAERCAIFVYNEERTHALAMYRYGYNEQMLAAHRGTDPIPPSEIPAEAEVICTGRPLQRRFPEDAGQWPLVTPGQERVEGRRRDLVLPLSWNGEVHGVSYIWRPDDPTPYSEEEIQTATTVGTLAALAIVFARQYELERISRQRLDALLDVATIATSEAGIDEILQRLARTIRSATEADVCSLFVFGSDMKAPLVSYQDGVDERERAMFRQSQKVPLDDVPAEVSARDTLESQVIRDFSRDLASNSALAEFVTRERVSEILLVPMAFQGQLIGVIYAWYRSPERTFSQAAIEMAQGIASQAGGVVARARLHEERRQHAAESDALLRIGQAVLFSDRLEPVLDEIAESLRLLIPYDYSYVGLLTGDRTEIRVIREWGDHALPIVDVDIPVEKSLSGLSVVTGQTVRTGDLEHDPRAWDDDPKSPPLHSILVAPLVSDTGTIGTLFVGRRALNAFDAHHERLLSLLSQHAALAIDRVRARETLANRERRDAFLTRVVDLLVSDRNPRDVLPEIAKRACGVIADGALIGLSGWEYGSIEWVAQSFNQEGLAEELSELMNRLEPREVRDRIEQYLRLEEIVLLDERTLPSEREYLRPILNTLNMNQALVTPLFQPERASGVMILFSSSDARPFTSEDIELGRIVGHRIGDALERDQIRRNQEALLRVSEALHGQSDLGELEDVLIGELVEILPCDQVFIAELDRDSECLRPHIYRSSGRDLTAEGEMPLDAGMCGEAIATRLPVMDNMAEQRGRRLYHSASERHFYETNGESALAAPLIAEDEVIGALFLSRTGHDRFTRADLETFLLFAGLAGAALDQATLIQHNRALYRASVEVLAAVVDAKDPMTLEHSRRVAHYSYLGATLLELPDEQAQQIELAGLLHDVGKLGIPDQILRKPGALTTEEFETIKRHPGRGADILARHPALSDLVPLVRHHHEWFNGAGYPDGLTGKDTPLGASIIAVADAFDTMTTQRTYQQRRAMDDALNELEQCAGTQFHPDVVAVFVRALREDPTLMYGSE